MPAEAVPLGWAEVHALGARLPGMAQHFEGHHRQALPALEKRLDAALAGFPEGAFVRLGSTSPKDSPLFPMLGGRVRHGDQVIRLLTSSQARIAPALRQAVRLTYLPTLFLRPWREIPRGSELRCFMRGRRLIGVSQYDLAGPALSDLGRDKLDALSAEIASFFSFFRRAVHLEDVVFDLIFAFAGTQVQLTLLELNPLDSLTDGCLFSWREDDFDGGFRYL